MSVSCEDTALLLSAKAVSSPPTDIGPDRGHGKSHPFPSVFFSNGVKKALLWAHKFSAGPSCVVFKQKLRVGNLNGKESFRMPQGTVLKHRLLGNSHSCRADTGLGGKGHCTCV